MTPLYNRVFVVPAPESQQSNGLSVSSNLVKAVVLYVGHSCAESIKKDTVVLHEKGVGMAYIHEQVKGYFLRDTEIITVL